MVREFKLPDVGEGVAEGEIVRWLVDPGDAVEEDQPVAEVETDKAVVDVPAPVDGTVRELLAEEGEVVPVGNVIITFDVAADEPAARQTESDDVAGEEDEAAEEADQAAEQPADTAEAEAEARVAEGAMEEAGTVGAEAAEEVADDAEAASAGDAGTEAAEEAADDAAEAEAEARVAEGAMEEAGTAGVEAAEEVADDAEAASAGDAGTEVAVDADEETATSGRVFAPPSVRRLAREEGVDLGTIQGSGPSGRITEDDVRAAASGESADAETAEPSGQQPTADEQATQELATTDEAGGPPARRDSSESADRDRTLAAPATRRVAREEGVDLDAVPATEQRDGEAFVSERAVREYARAQREAQAADAEVLQTTETDVPATEGTEAGGPTEAEAERETRRPYRGVRRTIGDRMSQSKFTAPHVTHHDTADATRLVEMRERLKPEAEERGIRLTYMPFIMKACVAALKEHPVVNSQLDEENEELVEKHYYNIGVAADTEAGLMVPVVDDVDRKGLLQISSETNELVQRARERSIERSEMQDGTFTITNFGAIGGDFATPIINYPEVAILGLGSIEQRPTVVDGEVEARHTLPLSLSIDHRVVDGADAARFTNTLIRYLEEPSLLLLD